MSVRTSEIRMMVNDLTRSSRIAVHSSIDAMMREPEYTKIKACGEEAVPILLEALREQPDTSMAIIALLVDITGENPMQKEDAGHVSRMAAAWLRWSRNRPSTGG
jgi:hypothetical protein